MARTTTDDVEEILEMTPGLDVTPYITAANLLITRVNTCATNKGITLTSAELEQMERWMAAHFYTVRDQRYIEKWTEKAKGMFDRKNDYAATAKALDPSGCLAAFLSGKRLVAAWLGKAPSDQTDYEDRD